jgi:hypothetical protein
MAVKIRGLIHKCHLFMDHNVSAIASDCALREAALLNLGISSLNLICLDARRERERRRRSRKLQLLNVQAQPRVIYCTGRAQRSRWHVAPVPALLALPTQPAS